MDVNFSPREIDWLNNYAGNKDLTVPAAVRQAVRVLSLVEGTPGAWDAINKLTSDRLGPKYDPLPPLPESSQETPAERPCRCKSNTAGREICEERSEPGTYCRNERRIELEADEHEPVPETPVDQPKARAAAPMCGFCRLVPCICVSAPNR